MKIKNSIEFPIPYSANPSGTWPAYSIIERLPQTIYKTICENSFTDTINQKLKTFAKEIPDKDIKYVKINFPDRLTWEKNIGKYHGINWLKAPWFFLEEYFYRRILFEIEYFDEKSDNYQFDPFLMQKNSGVKDGLRKLPLILSSLQKWQSDKVSKDLVLQNLIKINLWGNQADLSLWAADEIDQSGNLVENMLSKDEMLIIDQCAEACEFILSKSVRRIDFLIDNTGFELICDLLLVEYILENDMVGEVNFHLKPYPVFVSDAMENDVVDLIKKMSEHEDCAVSEMAKGLLEKQATGRFQFLENDFWVSPKPFWGMNPELERQLMRSDLIISKGDANYRRLLGDLKWEKSTKFSDIYQPWNPNLLAMRVIKSDILVEVAPDDFSRMRSQDADWMKDGQWGIVNYINWE